MGILSADRIRGDVLHLSNVIGPRPAGSREDAKALKLLKDRFESLGIATAVEEFEFTESLLDEWSLRVDGVEIPSIPCLSSPRTKHTVTGGLVDVGFGTEPEIGDVEGKVILARIGKVHESLKAEMAAAKGAVGAVFFAEEEEWGIYTGRLAYPRGQMPAFCVSSRDAASLTRLSRSRAQAELSVEARFESAKGMNLASRLEGRGDEEVVVTAHRDSRPHSPGANDNVSGTAVMLDVASGLADKKLDRSVVFISTDAEEYGLCGSSFHVGARASKGLHYAAAVNLDSMGQGSFHVVQKDRAGRLSAGLNDLVSRVGTRLGYPVKRRDFQNGSDCDPFMLSGTEACWIRGFPNTSFNSTTDTFEKLDYPLLAKMARLSRAVVEEAASTRAWTPPVRP